MNVGGFSVELFHSITQASENILDDDIFGNISLLQQVITSPSVSLYECYFHHWKV